MASSHKKKTIKQKALAPTELELYTKEFSDYMALYYPEVVLLPAAVKLRVRRANKILDNPRLSIAHAVAEHEYALYKGYMANSLMSEIIDSLYGVDVFAPANKKALEILHDLLADCFKEETAMLAYKYPYVYEELIQDVLFRISKCFGALTVLAEDCL